MKGGPGLGHVCMVHSMEPNQSSTDRSGESTDQGGGWFFPLLLAAVLLVLFGVAKFASPPKQQVAATKDQVWTPSAEPTGQTVGLTIDFGNGASKVFAALPWRAEMTVADSLAAARDFQPGIEFTQQGSGSTGFLTSLDGLENEGASGRNWIYRVDDRHAHQSFCLEKIEPGMHILWTFTDELYNDDSAEQ